MDQYSHQPYHPPLMINNITTHPTDNIQKTHETNKPRNTDSDYDFDSDTETLTLEQQIQILKQDQNYHLSPSQCTRQSNKKREVQQTNLDTQLKNIFAPIETNYFYQNISLPSSHDSTPTTQQYRKYFCFRAIG